MLVQISAKKNFQEFLGMVLGKSQEIPGFSLRNFARETGNTEATLALLAEKKYFLTEEIQARIILHMLQVKIKFRLKFLNLS